MGGVPALPHANDTPVRHKGRDDLLSETVLVQFEGSCDSAETPD
jgi:hypothetical protein